MYQEFLISGGSFEDFNEKREFSPIGGGGAKRNLLNVYSRPAGIIKNFCKTININWRIRFLGFSAGWLCLKRAKLFNWGSTAGAYFKSYQKVIKK